MCRAYLAVLEADESLVNGQTFNVGYENHSVKQLGEMVRNAIGKHVKIKFQSTDDNRSYHVSSAKIRTVLGFEPKMTIDDAIVDLVEHFRAGDLPNSLTDSGISTSKKCKN